MTHSYETLLIHGPAEEDLHEGVSTGKLYPWNRDVRAA